MLRQCLMMIWLPTKFVSHASESFCQVGRHLFSILTRKWYSSYLHSKRDVNWTPYQRLLYHTLWKLNAFIDTFKGLSVNKVLLKKVFTDLRLIPWSAANRYGNQYWLKIPWASRNPLPWHSNSNTNILKIISSAISRFYMFLFRPQNIDQVGPILLSKMASLRLQN